MTLVAALVSSVLIATAFVRLWVWGKQILNG